MPLDAAAAVSVRVRLAPAAPSRRFLPRAVEPPEDVEHLGALLEWAGAVEVARRGVRLRPAGYRCMMPEPLPDPSESYGWAEEELPPPIPSAGNASRSEAILGWIDLIPLDPGRPGTGERWSRHGGAMLRRLVRARSMCDPRTGKNLFSWRRLGRELGCSHEHARRWHAQGLDVVFARLCRLSFPSRTFRVATVDGFRY